MTSRKPPSRRDRDFISQHQARWLTSTFPGAMGGRSPSARPIEFTSTDQAAVEGGTADESLSTASFYRDFWTLSSDGAQTKTLTYVPLDFSEHVYLNGFEQWEGTDWSRTDTTLSVLTPMGAVSGDDLEVRYAYREGLPSTPTDIPPLDVPFSSTGWKYTTSDPGAGWADPSFDDSGWSTGQMPIGNAAYAAFADDDPNTTISTHTPNAVWVRRKLGPGTNITFSYRMALYLEAYVDGTFYTSQTFGAYHTASNLFPPIGDQTGIWTLALHVYDFTIPGPSGEIGVNIEITGDEA